MAQGDTKSGNAHRDELLIAALVTGCHHDEAVRRAKCSRSTLARRLRDPQFQERLDEARRGVLRRVTDTVTTQLLAASARLARALDSDDDEIGIKAAHTLFVHGIHLRELGDIAARLANIESRLPPER
jgi:hypothetical protein